MPEIVLAVVRIGIVVLLWLFVLAAVRVVRTDIYGPRAARPKARPAAQAKQDKSAKPAKPAKPPKKSGAPTKLVVTAGTLAGTSIPLRDAPVTIGRANDSMGSTNGTFLDRTKVTGPTSVAIGMPIRIGKTVMELRR